jgi:hypothetical protein
MRMIAFHREVDRTKVGLIGFWSIIGLMNISSQSGGYWSEFVNT